MASSLKKEIKKAKKCLLKLQDEVEEFETQLRQQTEQMKQSIDQLSIDYKSNSMKVWAEFDALVEKARLKAAELCDDMKRKTNEQQSKWHLSLREKENLLLEAGEWRNDLRHLLGAGNDDDDLIHRFQTHGSELSSRLRESSAPVEEGQIVVTFPDWCHRSLNDLREEMVDFAIRTLRTWPPWDLELRTECCLQSSKLRIYSIAGSDEDGHVFVVDGNECSIKEFAESGEFIDQCFCVGRGEELYPQDICCLSKDDFVVCGFWGSGSWGGLLFLARKKSRPFLIKEKHIYTKEIGFSSLCQMDDKIFVCGSNLKDFFCFSKAGEKIKTIKIGGWPGLGVHPFHPLLRIDPTTGNLWLTGERMSEIIIFNQNGQILQRVKTGIEIHDFCGDKFGHFYFCNKIGIFSVLPNKNLYKFPQKSNSWSTIFVSPQKLFVSFKNGAKYLIKNFQID